MSLYNIYFLILFHWEEAWTSTFDLVLFKRADCFTGPDGCHECDSSWIRVTMYHVCRVLEMQGEAVELDQNSKKIGDPPEENHNFRGIGEDSLTHGLCISQSTRCKCLGRAGTRQLDFWSPTPKTRRSPWKNNSWSSCDHRKNSALPTGLRTGFQGSRRKESEQSTKHMSKHCNSPKYNNCWLTFRETHCLLGPSPLLDTRMWVYRCGHFLYLVPAVSIPIIHVWLVSTWCQFVLAIQMTWCNISCLDIIVPPKPIPLIIGVNLRYCIYLGKL